jgi:hypothetical protein
MSRAACCFCCLAFVLVPAAIADELTYSKEKDGVLVKWTSTQVDDTTTHTWDITEDASTTVVVGRLDFTDPLAPVWTGTVDGEPGFGECLYFEQDDGAVGFVLFDREGTTLVYFDMPPKILQAMVPEFENGAEPTLTVKCVCWPPRTGNTTCTTSDCDNSVSCNPNGSTCMYRNMIVVKPDIHEPETRGAL